MVPGGQQPRRVAGHPGIAPLALDGDNPRVVARVGAERLGGLRAHPQTRHPGVAGLAQGVARGPNTRRAEGARRNAVPRPAGLPVPGARRVVVPPRRARRLRRVVAASPRHRPVLVPRPRVPGPRARRRGRASGLRRRMNPADGVSTRRVPVAHTRRITRRAGIHPLAAVSRLGLRHRRRRTPDGAGVGRDGDSGGLLAVEVRRGECPVTAGVVAAVAPTGAGRVGFNPGCCGGQLAAVAATGLVGVTSEIPPSGYHSPRAGPRVDVLISRRGGGSGPGDSPGGPSVPGPRWGVLRSRAGGPEQPHRRERCGQRRQAFGAGQPHSPGASIHHRARAPSAEVSR